MVVTGMIVCDILNTKIFLKGNVANEKTNK